MISKCKVCGNFRARWNSKLQTYICQCCGNPVKGYHKDKNKPSPSPINFWLTLLKRVK